MEVQVPQTLFRLSFEICIPRKRCEVINNTVNSKIDFHNIVNFVKVVIIGRLAIWIIAEQCNCAKQMFFEVIIIQMPVITLFRGLL